MNANQKPVAAALALMKFNNASVTVARPATDKEENLLAVGMELGAAAADNDDAWKSALRLIKNPNDRTIMRRGFISTFVCDDAPTEKAIKSAGNRFDYLARMFAKPSTSRQNKANAAKRASGGGRKEKTKTGEGKTLAPQAVAQRLVDVLACIAKLQSKHEGDAEMLEVLGEIAAIAGGSKPNAKRKAHKGNGAAVHA